MGILASLPGLALASFTAAALSAAEESCEMRFRQAVGSPVLVVVVGI